MFLMFLHQHTEREPVPLPPTLTRALNVKCYDPKHLHYVLFLKFVTVVKSEIC